MELRKCLREPIAEIAVATKYLDDAVSAHLTGDRALALDLIQRANLDEIREWTESIWGKNSPHVQYRLILNTPQDMPPENRIKMRMPSSLEKGNLHSRDGYHCRFCEIPVIRKEVRQRISKIYPVWGNKNIEQHAAFQAMWAQYDHILPHSKGGNNDLENIVLTCAPCNFGRMNYTLEEVGLVDPRKQEPTRSSWDGLERFK